MSAISGGGGDGTDLRTCVNEEAVCACYYHLRRKGDLRDSREHLSPRASGLGVFLSPVAGIPTLPGVITKLGMIPAEGILGRGLRRGWHVGRRAVPGGAAVARTVGTRQGSYQVRKSGYLFAQLLDFGSLFEY